jgi:hypothetical protein
MADHFEDVTKAATTHNVSAWMETTGLISENGAYNRTTLQIILANRKMLF